MTRKSFFVLFLLVFIALSANSQIVDIEPSWELNPTGDPPCDDVEKVVASLLEMNNGIKTNKNKIIFFITVLFIVI